VRQYDGASIRFGPMPTEKRQEMEMNLRIATENKNHFSHFDLDRTFNALQQSQYNHCTCDFEVFHRTSPFPQEFLPYYEGTLLWNLQFLSERSAKYLKEWMNEDKNLERRYFLGVDLVAILS
jgi:hypothetical protein